MRFTDCGLQTRHSFLTAAVLFLIGSVSLFFRALGWRACRFYPSCSVYATQAFAKKSFWQALGLAFQRFFKCHPLSPGGYDPIPESNKRDN